MNQLVQPPRVALVTAAGSGIGRATVHQLLADGLRVHAVDINHAALVRLAQAYPGAPLHTHVADATDEDAVADVVAAVAVHGALHILVNGVGSVCSGGLRELSLAEWRRKFDLNLTSVLVCSRAALPLLEQSTGDRVIVTLSSTLARVADPGTLAYGAFKAALEQMTRSMALELAPQRIRVVGVAPGPVAATEGEAGWGEDHYARFNPLQRFATPPEVATMIAWVASSNASYTTGTTLYLDGGDSALGIGWSMLDRIRPRETSDM